MTTIKDCRRNLARHYAGARSIISLAAREPHLFTKAEVRDAQDDVRCWRSLAADATWLHHFASQGMCDPIVTGSGNNLH